MTHERALLDLYFKEASRYPLLTRTEELFYARRMRRMNIPKKARDEARNQLISRNLRLVIRVAKRYRGSNLTMLDLIQEGNSGLVRATRTFNWRFGWKFSTYAFWWIRQFIRRALDNTNEVVRVPAYLVKPARRYKEMEICLRYELGREPTDKEIAQALKVPKSDIALLKDAARGVVSLEAMTPSDNEGDCPFDFIMDKRELSVEERLDHMHLKECTGRALRCLPPRERAVITLRFGLEDGVNHTLDEIALAVGVTRERIRQIELEAVARIRKHGCFAEWA